MGEWEVDDIVFGAILGVTLEPFLRLGTSVFQSTSLAVMFMFVTTVLIVNLKFAIPGKGTIQNRILALVAASVILILALWGVYGWNLATLKDVLRLGVVMFFWPIEVFVRKELLA